jgi:DNA invertase Pin-like site-specific DNA recombinase
MKHSIIMLPSRIPVMCYDLTYELTAARARGKRGGRRPSLKPKDIALVRKLYEDKQTPVEDICRMLKISRMTLWRYVKETKSQR